MNEDGLPHGQVISCRAWKSKELTNIAVVASTGLYHAQFARSIGVAKYSAQLGTGPAHVLLAMIAKRPSLVGKLVAIANDEGTTGLFWSERAIVCKPLVRQLRIVDRTESELQTEEQLQDRFNRGAIHNNIGIRDADRRPFVD